MRNLKIFTAFLTVLFFISCLLTTNGIISSKWGNVLNVFILLSYLVYFGRYLWVYRDL